ncbi:hypothetical protein ABPG77_004087 [Micractinium sp. CCAP 211/92]
MQPESEYRPPPATPSAGATATAAASHATGAATTKGSRRRGGYTSGGGSSDEAGSDEEDGGGGSGAGDSASLPRWLGPFWREECLEMEKAELMLQGDYDEQRCRRIGNEPVVQALVELKKFEEALNGAALITPAGQKRDNHKSLAYAQAAAAVRTCAYRLRPPVLAGQLPYMAANIAEEVTAILETGTCPKLEGFRRNEPVYDSKGFLRLDSAGAAVRRQFCRLNGVGAKTARAWWEAGCRTFGDVEAAAARPKAPLKLTEHQRFSLRYREHFLEGTTAEDVAEMAAALATALESVSGQAGWQIELAGGSRRKRPAATPAGASSTEPGHASVQGPDAAQAGSHGSGAVVEGQRGDASSGDAGAAELAGGGLAAGSRSTIGGSKFITGILAGRHHDADFVISHPTHVWDERFIAALRDELVQRRRLVSASVAGAMSSLQYGRTRDLEPKLLQELTADHNDHRGNIVDDRLDHLLGTFLTSRGRYRRIDIILATPEQLPFGLIAWIGSTMFNRFLRRCLGHWGMHMNSLGLYRVRDGRICRVPDGAPPLHRSGREHWPPGWGPADSGGADAGGKRVDSGHCSAPQQARDPGEKPPRQAAAVVSTTGRPAATSQPDSPPAATAAAAAAEAAPPCQRGAGSWRRVRCQRDVFELLGLPWREPFQRDMP